MSSEELSYKRTFTVLGPVAAAFDEFTNPVGGWWPRDHSRADDLVVVGFDPYVSGRWFGLRFDNSREDRGAILSWDPPHRFLVEWPLAGGEDLKRLGCSELEVTFRPHPGNMTLIAIEHRHIERTPNVDRVKSSFFAPYGWDLLVFNFQAYLASLPWPPGLRQRVKPDDTENG